MERAIAALEELRAPALAWDPNLERPYAKTLEQVKGAFEKFGEKVTRARAQKDEVALRRLAALREYCQPHGTLHERVLAGAHFRGRYGEGAMTAILDQLDIGTADVQLLRLPEVAVATAAVAEGAAVAATESVP
jgi:hypothetical protein